MIFHSSKISFFPSSLSLFTRVCRWIGNEIRVAGLLGAKWIRAVVRGRGKNAGTACLKASFENVAVSYYDPAVWLTHPVWFRGLFVARAQTAWTTRINHQIRRPRPPKRVHGFWILSLIRARLCRPVSEGPIHAFSALLFESLSLSFFPFFFFWWKDQVRLDVWWDRGFFRVSLSSIRFSFFEKVSQCPPLFFPRERVSIFIIFRSFIGNFVRIASAIIIAARYQTVHSIIYINNTSRIF